MFLRSPSLKHPLRFKGNHSLQAQGEIKDKHFHRSMAQVDISIPKFKQEEIARNGKIQDQNPAWQTLNPIVPDPASPTIWQVVNFKGLEWLYPYRISRGCSFPCFFLWLVLLTPYSFPWTTDVPGFSKFLRSPLHLWLHTHNFMPFQGHIACLPGQLLKSTWKLF